jgi:hypothetical protein
MALRLANTFGIKYARMVVRLPYAARLQNNIELMTA